MATMRGLSYVALVGLLFLSSGCVGRIVGEGAEKTLGPKGVFWEEKPVAANHKVKALGNYSNFELGLVKNEYGRNVPSDFIPKFKAEFAKQLRESKLPKDASGKTMVINVEVIHYESADTTDNVLGPLEQVVARVSFVDKNTQQVVASGNAVGRTGKTVGMGVDHKAQGLGRALIKWVSTYYPKGAAEKDEED